MPGATMPLFHRLNRSFILSSALCVALTLTLTLTFMGVHLHYTQLKSGAAVRIAFNGTPINVWQGAKKSDGTYPTQELLSNNIPTGITVGFVSGGVTATSLTGAGVRAVALCENVLKHIESSIEGPRVAAKQTSTTKCPAGWLFSDATYALE